MILHQNPKMVMTRLFSRSVAGFYSELCATYALDSQNMFSVSIQASLVCPFWISRLPRQYSLNHSYMKIFIEGKYGGIIRLLATQASRKMAHLQTILDSISKERSCLPLRFLLC